MPELPEVETTVNGLRIKVLNRTFIDIWTDSFSLIKKPPNFADFKKAIKGRKILDIKRKGKNIVFYLSGGIVMLVHQKMTGHLLFGKWKKQKEKWVSGLKGPLKEDPQNRFIRVVFFLNNGFQIALSDLRKFAKIEIWEKTTFNNGLVLNRLGPDAMEVSFDYFKKKIKSRKAKIKQVLMDQNFISGIGNIYSDEILFLAGVNPQIRANAIPLEKLKKIYKAMRNVLKLAVDNGGTSFSDYRNPNGIKGNFGNLTKVYRKTGQMCPQCKTEIKRLKIGGRSAHFCPNCQKI